MEPPTSSPEKTTTIAVSRTIARRLRDLFPTSTYEEAIEWLVGRYGDAIGDPAACSNTELWIKLDRLEEVMSLLALTNVDLADIYRRQVSGELLRLRECSGHLAEIAETVPKGGAR